MHILFAFDRFYNTHAQVVINSLISNNKRSNITIHLMTDFCLSENEIKNYKKISSKVIFNFYTVNSESISGLKISGHASIAAYFRLLAPIYLKNIEKVLYLDVDVIVNTCIEELWNLDIKNAAIAAVAEAFNIGENILGIDINGKYFNSGVLLINLTFWRENLVSKNVIKFIDNNRENIVYWDQDGLNAVLKNDWISIPEKWNLCESHLMSGKSYSRKSIIHYTGEHKPWNDFCLHPFVYLYDYYSLQSGGFNFLKIWKILLRYKTRLKYGCFK